MAQVSRLSSSAERITFFAGAPRPEALEFVRSYRAKYSLDPDAASAVAYDAIVLFAKLVQNWGPTREAMQKGLGEVHDVSSVAYGTIAFDEHRSVLGASFQRLAVRGNRFTLWDGAKPT